MPGDRYRVEPLGSHHDCAGFSCGVDALDRYFREQAGQGGRRKVAANFVLRDTETEAVAGYYTLSASSIEPAQLPPDVLKRLPRYSALPAVLLGRLALDVRYRGQGLGQPLLFNALRRALAASDQIAAVAVVVDAKDETAQRFYERHLFRRFVDDPQRLFFPMTTIANLQD